MGEKLVEVVRGQYDSRDAVEITHFGSIAVVDGDNKLVFGFGDPLAPTHLRSTAKPFQLLPFIKRNLHKKYGLSDAEVALLMSSHSGEPLQVAMIEGILKKVHVQQSELLCGVHAPTSSEARKLLAIKGEKAYVIHNNCSGKHCAMAAVAKEEGWGVENYLEADHLLQKEIAESLVTIAGVSPRELGVGVDGCSAPTFIMPLDAIARLYAALQRPDLRYLFEVGAHNPAMIAGLKRLDTQLMEIANGGLFAKTGADGVYAMSVKASAKYPTGLGIAIKIDDGDYNHRARQSVALALLIRLGVISEESARQVPELAQILDGTLKNHRGLVVGQTRVVF